MDKFRKVLFWIHLAAGVVAGVIILIMSVTGVLLAYERQMLAGAENFSVTSPSAISQKAYDRAVANAAEHAGAPPTQVTIRSNPTDPVAIAVGRERVIYANPYTGEVLGEGATGLRTFFHWVEELHRWLAGSGDYKNVGRAVTGACNAAFVVIILTGPFIWWPRKRKNLRAASVPDLKLKGKARDWNWHNSIGIWTAPILLVISATGMVMSYPWASNLIYKMTGNEPPPARTGGGGNEKPPKYVPPAAGYAALLDTAAKQVADWQSITLRLPQNGKGPVVAMIEEANPAHPFARSSLSLDANTAAVVKWEPFSANNLGRKVRSWVRPLHTGEAGGILGQTLAMLVSAGTALLVWTGLALTWRRFFGKQNRKNSASSPVSKNIEAPLVVNQP